jgi:hypothetical protein
MDESELKGLLSEERESIRQEMRNEIAMLFKRETEVLQERIQLYLKVGQWCGVIALAILTAFGFTKADDVVKSLETYFKQRLEEQYKLDDPSSSISVSLSRFMDQALVASAYIESKAAQARDSDRHPQRPDRQQEIKRLLRIVKDPTSSVETFDQAISGLSYLAGSDESRTHVAQELALLLAADEHKNYGWVGPEEQKALILLSYPSSVEIDVAATRLLPSNPSEKIMLGILKRLRNENHRPAVKAITAVADSTDSKLLKYESMLALATLQPASQKLRDFVLYGLLAEKNNNQKIKNVEVAVAIYESRLDDEFLIASDKFEARKKMVEELVVPLMSSAIDAGVRVEDLSCSGGSQLFGLSDAVTVSLRGNVYDGDFIGPLFQYANNISMRKLVGYMESMRPVAKGEKSAGCLKFELLLGESSVIKDEDNNDVALNEIKGRRVEVVRPKLERWQQDALGVVPVNVEGDYLLLSWFDLNGKSVTKKASMIKSVLFTVSERL